MATESDFLECVTALNEVTGAFLVVRARNPSRHRSLLTSIFNR